MNGSQNVHRGGEMPVTPFTPDSQGRCPDCSGSGPHYCGSAPVRNPVCWYCWAAVNPIVKRGLLKGWERFCSDVCKKLYARPADARPSPATRKLIAQVAAVEPVRVAA